MFAVLELSDFLIIAVVVAFAASGISVYLRPTERARLARVEAKVDLLLKHAGLVYDPKAAPPAVLDALQRGNKMEAIRLYREASGVGLGTPRFSWRTCRPARNPEPLDPMKARVG